MQECTISKCSMCNCSCTHCDWQTKRWRQFVGLEMLPECDLAVWRLCSSLNRRAKTITKNIYAAMYDHTHTHTHHIFNLINSVACRTIDVGRCMTAATKVKFIKHTLSNYNLSICMCDECVELTVRKISIPPFIVSIAYLSYIRLIFAVLKSGAQSGGHIFIHRHNVSIDVSMVLLTIFIK